MAVNDAIQLALNRFDELGQRFGVVETKVDGVQSDVRGVRKDLRFQRRSIVWPIVLSVLLGALGIMATIHFS